MFLLIYIISDLKCLRLASENSETPLTDECKQKLLSRIQMFESADKVCNLTFSLYILYDVNGLFYDLFNK